MKINDEERIDEVSRYYCAPTKLESIGNFLFWLNALLSFSILFSEKLPSIFITLASSFFITGVLLQFSLSQINRFYLIPRAEKERRKQMLSNAFGAPLSHDKTHLYYNNNYLPSLKRLGANTMENALFSSEVSARMLSSERKYIVLYLASWVILFSLRNVDLNVVILTTQIVFSGEIIAQWLSLEVLRFRQERVYDMLHAYFLNQNESDSPKEFASIIDLVVEYETAKSSTSCLLSSTVFAAINSEVTRKWEKVRIDLNMSA